MGRSGLCDILIQLVCCDSEGRGGLVLAIVEKDSSAGDRSLRRVFLLELVPL